MSAATITNIKTWANNNEEEDGMNDGHSHIWLRMIEQCGIESFTHKNILDFGCNQGGFLRLLNHKKPFKSALGVDIAEDSLAKATAAKPANAPIAYQNAAVLETKANEFDVAFSHEVIYLLPDLKAHAQTINRVLKSGGIYFAAIGCYIENPLWPKWREYIASYSNVPVPDYSINDYANAFLDAGFKVEARALKPDDFMEYNAADKVYFPTVIDHINYHTNNKILFKLTK